MLEIRQRDNGSWAVVACMADDDGKPHEMGVVKTGFASQHDAELWRQAYIAPLIPGHPRWNEFIERLGGLEGCNFRKDANDEDIWTRDSQDTTKPFCRSIMLHMDIGAEARISSLKYFEEHGGGCDCEVLMNVDRGPGDEDPDPGDDPDPADEDEPLHQRNVAA